MSMASRMPLARSSSMGAGSFGNQEVQENRELLPVLNAIRQDGGEESRRCGVNALALPLKSTCPSSSRSLHIHGHAGIEDRVQLVAVRSTQVQLHQCRRSARANRPDSCPCSPFERMELVRVGLLAEDRGAVVVGEGLSRSSRCRSGNRGRRRRVSSGAPGSGARASVRL
jgi:hypothetical protein